MRRLLLIGICAALASATGSAHFVFVVPQGSSPIAQVLLSETLQPDAQVDVALIARAQLSLRDTRGRETPLSLVKADHAFAVTLPAESRGVIHGIADIGVMTGSAPHVLLYYPKTILGDPFESSTRLGSLVPVELVPSGGAGAVSLQLLARQKPVANADVTVLTPDGMPHVVKTDAGGLTPSFSQSGRYGAWARHWEKTPGQRDGRAYDEVRHYATLVFDVSTTTQAAWPLPQATRVATLPEPTSSFGAVATDGWLYVYGGHVSPTHVYSTSAVSGRFSRLRLRGSATWESLPDGPAVQGMNMVAHHGLVYRVGGMQPHNRPGDPEDTRSLADVARFNPIARQWEKLPSLPAPRSSHDVVVSGDRLFVIGGWNLQGTGEKTQWATTTEVLDLASASSAWTSLPQPFKRRAFIAVGTGNLIYVLGGFDDQNRVVRGVDIYDVAANTWTAGPALPGDAMNGFGPAATVVNSRVVVSIDDGSLYRLTANGGAWELVGHASPRIVHRLVADGDRVLILGGAKGGANLDSIEALALQP